jgi:hypothetical protein
MNDTQEINESTQIKNYQIMGVKLKSRKREKKKISSTMIAKERKTNNSIWGTESTRNYYKDHNQITIDLTEFSTRSKDFKNKNNTLLET